MLKRATCVASIKVIQCKTQTSSGPRKGTYDIDSRQLTYEEVKSRFEKEGYKLLSTEYNNAKGNLKVICPFGHEWETNIGALVQINLDSEFIVS
jgi:hypothetical protein